MTAPEAKGTARLPTWRQVREMAEADETTREVDALLMEVRDLLGQLGEAPAEPAARVKEPAPPPQA